MRHQVPPGGVLLGGDERRLVPIPKTSHVTDFQDCNADIHALTAQDEKGVKVIGYAIRIHDQNENHLYVYKFGQDSLMVFQERLASFPNVGDYIEEEGKVEEPADGDPS